MRRLVMRWLFTAVPLVFGVSVLTFVLASQVPGDAARSILGINANPEQYEALRKQLKLDQPLWTQYWHWLSRAVHGDFGRSIQSSDAVGHELTTRLAVTLSLVGGAVLVSVVVGVALGGRRSPAVGAVVRRFARIGAGPPLLAGPPPPVPPVWVCVAGPSGIEDV